MEFKKELNDMNTIDAILSRKSVRNFSSQEIEEEKINLLLKAAMAAPSAVNKQPWKFVVAKKKDKKEEIKSVMRFGKYDSPIIIIPCVKETSTIPTMHDLAYCDLGAATENILLAAHELGLGAVWCAIYPNKKHIKQIRKILDLGALTSPFAAIYVGYPSDDDKSKVRDKFDEKNIVTI